MATKSKASDLIRGLSVAINFIDVLQEEIVKAGGYEEMLHFLTKEHARPLMAKVAKIIVESEWQVPFSLIMRMAKEGLDHHWATCDDKKTHPHGLAFLWGGLANIGKNFGIMEERFSNHEHDESPVVPGELTSQIVGKRLTSPFFVVWKGEQYVITCLWAPNKGTGDFAGVGEMATSIENLSIAQAKFFNFEQ